MKRWGVEFRVVDGETIQIDWTRALGPSGSEPYQLLADLLQATPGVNRVEVLRYSALVVVAPHVASLDAVLIDLQDTFEHDPWLQSLTAD